MQSAQLVKNVCAQQLQPDAVSRDYLSAWEALTGRKAVFVEERGLAPDESPTLAGAGDPAQPNRIYLHARGNRTLVALAGHEWAHTLAESNPTLFREIAQKLRPLVMDWQARTGAVIAGGYAEGEADEEVIANIIGYAGEGRLLAKYLKPDLLIIDDMGLKILPPKSGEILLEIVMRRYENRSTLMTSNRPIDEWGKLLSDVPAASAILDRLLHHAEVIAITGRSYRLQDSANQRTLSKPKPCPPS